MDTETLALCKQRLAGADAAADRATEAASAAESAVAAIYHDKNFILTVNEDGSLSLTYDPSQTEEE